MTLPLFDRLQDVADRLDASISEATRLREKLETDILLADALAALRSIPSSGVSEGKRVQIAAVKRRISQRICA